MHAETLYLKTKNLVGKIKNAEFLKEFYLAGGTGLALQLGHRKSMDLDFFSKNYPPQEQLIQDISRYSPKVTQQSKGTLDVYIDDVKVSFFEYKYPLLESTINYQGLEIAQMLDIACMKVSAIASRGTKKDFVDLYMILQCKSLEEILNAFEKKYEDVGYQRLHLLKSLVYFEDAESDPEPDYLIELKWDDVKVYLEKQVANF
jgi:hypothetical protein